MSKSMSKSEELLQLQETVAKCQKVMSDLSLEMKTLQERITKLLLEQKAEQSSNNHDAVPRKKFEFRNLTGSSYSDCGAFVGSVNLPRRDLGEQTVVLRGTKTIRQAIQEVEEFLSGLADDDDCLIKETGLTKINIAVNNDGTKRLILIVM